MQEYVCVQVQELRGARRRRSLAVIAILCMNNLKIKIYYSNQSKK
jgi:hypothetical protein